jgi:hypothetical protein
MKKMTNHSLFLVLILLIAGYNSMGQSLNATGVKSTSNASEMKSYLIEREIPDAGKFTVDELKGISQASCSVLKSMGPKIEWVHSYVTGNKIYCIYKAESPELIKEHAKKGGFPANSIIEIATIISPATAK